MDAYNEDRLVAEHEAKSQAARRQKNEVYGTLDGISIKARPNTVIDDNIDHVKSLITEVRGCVSTVKGIKDRNFGSVPECTESSDKPATPEGKIYELAGSISTLQTYISDLRTIINELNERL